MVEKGKGFQIFANVLLALLSICAVAPFILLIMSSFTDEQVLISNGYSFFPAKFSTYAYEYLLTDSTSVIRGYGISFLITAVGTVCNLLLTTLYAYPLSRRDLPGRNGFAFYLFFTMLFSGGLVPSYIMWTRTFHISNTIFALLIPNLLMGAFNVIMVRTYFTSNIPEAVIEAARIDGANELKTFVRIVIPLAMPMLACIAVYIGVGHWNSWFDVSLYSRDGTWDTLQIILYRLLNQANAKADITNQQQLYMSMRTIQPETVRAATTVVVVVPIIFIYPFFQR